MYIGTIHSYGQHVLGMMDARHRQFDVTMVVFLLSLVGVPPLAGFVGRLQLFGAALNTGHSVVAVGNSVLSLAVYLCIVSPMYRRGTPLALNGPRSGRSGPALRGRRWDWASPPRCS